MNLNRCEFLVALFVGGSFLALSPQSLLTPPISERLRKYRDAGPVNSYPLGKVYDEYFPLPNAAGHCGWLRVYTIDLGSTALHNPGEYHVSCFFDKPFHDLDYEMQKNYEYEIRRVWRMVSIEEGVDVRCLTA